MEEVSRLTGVDARVGTSWHKVDTTAVRFEMEKDWVSSVFHLKKGKGRVKRTRNLWSGTTAAREEPFQRW
jgi:hypothetical protein